MTDIEVQHASGSAVGANPGLPAACRTAERWRAIRAHVACAALAASLPWHHRPVLLWNASASAPRGLYRLTSPGSPRTGDMVAAWAPRAARRLAAARAYLPATVPLVKPVAAIAGDRVCAAGSRIFVNGRAAAVRRVHDPSGRPMPWWHGCRLLRQGEIFLLSAGVRNAFDGRYFGVIRGGEIIGGAKLLWAAPAEDPNDG